MLRKLCIHCVLLMLLTSEAWADVVLIMRREAEASGNYIRICDIARVEGPRDQTEEIAMIVLGRTPGKGQIREFTRWDIEYRLFEMGIRARVTFTGNDMVRVFGDGGGRRFGEAADESTFPGLVPLNLERISQAPFDSSRGDPRRESAGWERTGKDGTIAALPYKPAARAFEPRENPAALLDAMSSDARIRIGNVLSEYLAGKYPRSDIEVEAKLVSVDGEIPSGAYEVKVLDAVSGQVPGRATLRLSVKKQIDDEPRNVVVAADTTVFGLAPVAARQLNRGELLNQRDVLITRVRMESGKAYLPPSSKSVSGREMKRSLKAGEPVTAADAVPGEAVKRGDLVVVDTTGKGWQIRTTAKALGSGMVDDLIQVEDVGTKAKYTARITGRGEVSAMAKKDKLNNK